MTLTHRSHRPHQGYTLVELLVVIAILGILMGMLMVAIFPALFRGKDLQARYDISEMQVKLGEFKSHFNAKDNIPSRLALWEDKAYVPQPGLEYESKVFLEDVFSSRLFVKRGAADFNDWDGNGVMGTTVVVLEGHEVLVFLLGGIPARGQVACTGFSIKATSGDPTYPSNVTPPGNALPTDTRAGPFFNFKTDRLKPTKGQFMAYADPFNTGRFYAFFTHYGRDNGYNRHMQVPLPGSTVVPSSDCQSLGVWPYFSGNGVYHNPKTFQIICAGKDGRFGPGRVVFGPTSPVTGDGADDLSNFHNKQLGAQ